jgi:light-regulated signal transduction histidine kinase (bacteriophytochrome)
MDHVQDTSGIEGGDARGLGDFVGDERKITGIGIAPEDQAKIFEEFRQVGGDYSHKKEGTGLGLKFPQNHQPAWR